MSRIDAHLHVFAEESAPFPRQTDHPLSPERGETVEKLMSEMEPYGVEQAVLVQIGGTSIEHHAYLRHCVRTYPTRFRGIGLLPQDGNPADHMDRLADDGGIIGFRLSSMGGPADPAAPVDVGSLGALPIWRHAAEKDYVLWLYPGESDARCVPPLMREFPHVRVVFNHIMVCPGQGKFSWDGQDRPRVEVPMPPPTAAALEVPEDGPYPFPNAHVLISGQYAFSNEAWPYRDLAAWHERLLRSFGPERMMWATDFPWITTDPGYGRLVRLLDELLPSLTETERESVMGGTARRVLGFPQTV